MTRISPYEKKMWGVSTFFAPLLMTLSTFFWRNGEVGTTGGTLMVLALTLWIIAFIGLFSLVKEKMPLYAQLGLLVAVYGCIGGCNFGFEGFYREVFNISKESRQHLFLVNPLPFNLTLFYPGPLFPLSLLLLGIMLVRINVAPIWVGGLIALGGVVFPIGRILRMDIIAHLTDCLLLVPMTYMSFRLLTKTAETT